MSVKLQTITELEDKCVDTVSYTHLKATERYRSGHNEAVLKTVCPKGRVGSNPTRSAKYLMAEATNLTWRRTQAGEGAPLLRE